jgi:hypothetical protein
MFLWVSMMLDELANTCSESDFVNVLLQGPGDIDLLYQRIVNRLNKLPSYQKEWLRHIFYWIVNARRPLEMRELEHGVCLSRKIELQKVQLDRHFDFEGTLNIC